jgi:hypothetical protein
MGFWNEIVRLYNQPSKIAGKGVFKMAKGIGLSDKEAAAGARMSSASTRALGGDPFAFRPSFEGSDLGMTDTEYRKGRQMGDWIGSAIGSLFIGGAIGGGAAAAGGGGGEAAGGGAGAGGGGLTSGTSMFGETLGPAGEGGGGAAAGGSNWQNLLRQMPKQGMGGGQNAGGGPSLSYIIAQQQAEEAAKQAQEMLGGDTNLIDYMARMQMQNNLRRVG